MTYTAKEANVDTQLVKESQLQELRKRVANTRARCEIELKSLSELITQLLEMPIEKFKTGNKEFFLNCDKGAWRAEIGSTCRHVRLGEATGEYGADGSSAEEAVRNLIDKITKGDRER